MRILTVRQPWAWAIIHGGKDLALRNPRALDEPILYKGALGLRKIDLERLTTPQLYALAVATS